MFCGQSRKLSREHIWPTWLNDVLPGTGGFHFVRETEQIDPKPQGAWGAETLNMVVRHVCVECNTGWLSVLEELARPILSPMIRGQPTFLYDTHQETVAKWITKMALIFQFAQGEPRTAFSQEDRLAFYDSGAIPDGLILVLASYWGKKTLWYRTHDLKFALPDEVEDPVAPRYDGYAATFAIGHLVFRCFRVPTEVPDAGVQIGYETSQFVIDLWPPNPLIRFVRKWPPLRLLEDDGLNAFSLWGVDAIE